jgi:hypothetical protein
MWPSGPLRTIAPLAIRPRVVRATANSPCAHSDRSLHFAEVRISGLRPEPVWSRHFVRRAGRFARGDWLDRMCVSKNAQSPRSLCLEPPAGAGMGHLASPGHRFLGGCGVTRCLSLYLFLVLRSRYDGHARAHLLDVGEHKQRPVGPADAHQFDGFLGRLRSRACDGKARSELVRNLRRRAVGHRGRSFAQTVPRAENCAGQGPAHSVGAGCARTLDAASNQSTVRLQFASIIRAGGKP